MEIYFKLVQMHLKLVLYVFQTSGNVTAVRASVLKISAVLLNINENALAIGATVLEISANALAIGATLFVMLVVMPLKSV